MTSHTEGEKRPARKKGVPLMPGGGACGARGAPGRGRALRAAASAGPVPGGLPGSGPPLDYKPRLGQKELVALGGATAAAAATAAAVEASPAVSLVVTLAAGGLAREMLLERLHSERYVSPAELATPGSGFGEFGGLNGVHFRVHRAVTAGQGEAVWACHFFHGFGASLFSWLGILQKAAEGCNGVCSAHDAPGFGLTWRPAKVEAFSPSFNAKVGAAVLEAAVAEEAEMRAEGNVRRPSPRRALVGHSLGALTAMIAASSQSAGQYDAMVLVAPAVFAPSLSRPSAFHRAYKSIQERVPDFIPRICCALARKFLSALSLAVQGFILFTPARFIILVFLRKLVRARNFWMTALRACYHDDRRVTQKVVDGYRAAKDTAGWDIGLLKFTVAMFRAGLSGPSPSKALEGLAHVARTQKLPILIVHGAQDRVVPPSNSARLAEALPGCTLSVWPDTGHLPHEEHPERFVNEISQFLREVQRRA